MYNKHYNEVLGYVLPSVNASTMTIIYEFDSEDGNIGPFVSKEIL